MTLLRTEATGIFKRPLLPSLPTYHEEPVVFSPQDISKIIEQIVNKGAKYAQLKKTLTAEQNAALPEKLQQSNFVAMVKKIVIKMGEERRLGNGLRGFSKLLLQEIENQCWQLIIIERTLLELGRKEQQQLAALNQLFQKNITHNRIKSSSNQ